MQFKDVKNGYPIYILDKDSVELSQGVVKSISFPHADTSQPMYGNNALVVDVSIEANGKCATYTIPESLQITYAGNLVLSTSKEVMANEVEAMKNSAEQILSSVDHHRDVISKSSKLLSELSPSYRDKAQTEERFTKIESDMGEMKDMLSSIIHEFKRPTV